MLTRDENHRYFWNGAPVPGVTGVLEPLDELWHVPPDVLAAKADLGTRVHLACELDDADDLDEASVEDDVAPYLDAWRRFRVEKRVQVLSTEEYVYHPLHRYAGQLDRVLGFDGAKWLGDIKTSVGVYPSVGPQTAAYLAAKGDPTITRRAAIQLKPDGTYRLVELNDPRDWPVFLSCLTIHHFKESKRV
jgi:hypothetical protein